MGQISSGKVSSTTSGEDCANAARIVQCINALAGIEDPAKAISLARVALLYAVGRFTSAGMEPSAGICSVALAALTPPPAKETT